MLILIVGVTQGKLMKINKYSIILQYLDACKKSMDLAKLYDAEKTEKILIKLQASEKKVEKIEKELGGFVRGIRVDKKETPKDNCVICGKKAKEVVYIAKSY